MKLTQAKRKARADKNNFSKVFRNLRRRNPTQSNQFNNLFQVGKIKYSYKNQNSSEKYKPYAYVKKDYARTYDKLHIKHNHTRTGRTALRL